MNDRISANASRPAHRDHDGDAREMALPVNGPKGWLRVSPTHIMYSRREGEEFLSERAAKTLRCA